MVKGTQGNQRTVKGSARRVTKGNQREPEGKVHKLEKKYRSLTYSKDEMSYIKRNKKEKTYLEAPNWHLKITAFDNV